MIEVKGAACPSMGFVEKDQTHSDFCDQIRKRLKLKDGQKFLLHYKTELNGTTHNLVLRRSSTVPTGETSASYVCWLKTKKHVTRSRGECGRALLFVFPSSAISWISFLFASFQEHNKQKEKKNNEPSGVRIPRLYYCVRLFYRLHYRNSLQSKLTKYNEVQRSTMKYNEVQRGTTNRSLNFVSFRYRPG